jgi:hypothetical protein
LSDAATPAPDGEPLDWTHRAIVEPLLLARWGDGPPEQRLSDPWFANLLLFRDAHDWRFHAGDWPVISGRAYDGTRLVLPLFDLGSAPLELLRARLQGHDAFGPLSMVQAQALDPAHFVSCESRDDADYLYPAERFEFAGAALHGQRNLVRQLQREHALQAETYRPALAAEAQSVLGDWMAAKGKPAGDADERPCLQALAESDRLGLSGFLFRIEGQAVGFVLAQALGDGVQVMRLAKGRDGVKGLYPAMFQHFCRATPGVRWLNFEQDLGHANFRRTKLSYRPAALLAKLRVTLRG